MENQQKNLYQRISAVMRDIEYLQKDDTVGSGNYGYKAISIEKVTEAVRVAMVTHGLVILPVEQVHVMEDKIRANNRGEQVVVPVTTVDVRYKIVNIDNPAESEIIVSAGTGVDPQDKGVGKAMTYAYKNMLLRTFAIPTGDDTDKTHNKELEEQQNKAAKKAASQQTNAQQKPAEAPKSEVKPMTAEQRSRILELLKDPAQGEDTVKRVTAKLDSFTYEQAMKTGIALKKNIADKAMEGAKA